MRLRDKIMAFRREDDETGASLVIVLVFITVFGLILSGLLTEAGASVRFTGTVNNYEAGIYTADAGVALGIQQIRLNNDMCPELNISGTPIPDMAIPAAGATPAKTAKVTCEVTSGETWGGSGLAALTLSTDSDSLVLNGSASQTIKFSGPVFVNGGIQAGGSTPTLQVGNGNLYERNNSYCPTTPTPTMVSPYIYRCVSTSEVPMPNPAHVAPTTVPTNVPASADPAYSVGTSCRVFYPGLYTTPPNLLTGGGDNYFASGVYYFNFTNSADIFNVKQARVFGGQPTSYDKSNQQLGETYSDGITTTGSKTFKSSSASFTSADVGRHVFSRSTTPEIPTSTTIVSVTNNSTVELSSAATASASGISFTIGRMPSCGQTDPSGTGISGNGVEFVFGGTSRMYIDTQGDVELFARKEATATTATQNMTVVAVPSDWAGWNPNKSLTIGSTFLDVNSGNTTNFVTHGLIYAPTQNMILKSTNDVISQTLQGIVANKLTIKASNSGDGVAVSVPAGAPNPRRIKVTATTQTAGERAAVSRAIIEVANDASRTVTLKSWRTRGVADPDL